MKSMTIQIKEKQDVVVAGQVRYNDSGIHVLIVHGKDGDYDAIVMESGNTSTRRYGRNSVGQVERVIMNVYPFVAEATLVIEQ